MTHVHRETAVDAAVRLIGELAAAGITCVLPAEEAEAIRAELGGLSVDTVPVGGELPDDVELALVFGGDGTILRGAEWSLHSEAPLIGVNLGHVGFLAEAESSEIDQLVRHVVERDYEVEERVTLEVTVCDASGHEVWRSFAINEVSLEKAARERMLEVMVSVDGRPLSRWGCDGVLVATPTGSTAYAFSAGGPVIWPGVQATLLVPLSAHALFARPLVLGPQSCVDLELLPTPGATGVVWSDGRRSTSLEAGMSVGVRPSPRRLRLARLSSAPFTDRLVRKFGLRVEGWRGARDPGPDRVVGASDAASEESA